MRNNVQKAFTLVELIVVITILAILGTIAFLSLQGYSADARNSKRSSDLNNIESAMTTAHTKGTSLMSFVTATTGKKLIAGAAVG
jgi:prepilin-type N-terminal cleavage/methylation domain-containing protein